MAVLPSSPPSVNPTIGQVIVTQRGINYFVKPDHHRPRPTPTKSVWCISVIEEVHCFENAIDMAWLHRATGWGLHLVRAVPIVLGQNVLYRVKVGKFVYDASANQWHGYPADYLRKPQDRPPTDVLRMWLASSIIRKYEITRVRQGKPCSLSD